MGQLRKPLHRNAYPSLTQARIVVDAAADKTPAQDETKVGQFAVTNVAELLERSAYYGFVSVFGLYLNSLGYGGAVIGAIGAILLAFPYVIPLFSGAIAEKVGYKPAMLVALTSYTAGFAVLATVPNLGGILAGILLVATGAGGFKPVATATIAHVTAERHRSLGYTIYYTGINVGGFLGPLAVAFLTDSFRAGFAVAGAIMAGCLLLTLSAFRNPQPPQKDTSVGQALAKLGTIRNDPKLIVLLAIFSGFWFLYSMNFSFMALYLDRFVALPSWFEANLQQSFNPLIIIVLAIPLGAFATRSDPRRMMTAGVLLYVIGFTILAFIQHIGAFLLGLFIATLGEILAYPAFLAYIARIAPKDRVAVYQSYGFIPLFIGFFFGPLATGPVYQALAVDAGRPELFWAVPISVGVLALAGFLVLAARDTQGTQRRSGLARAGLVLLLIPALFAGAVLAGTQGVQDDGMAPGLTAVRLDTLTGTTQEGATTQLPFDVPSDAVGNLTFLLTWQDEVAQGAAVNRPDTFRLRIVNADGTVLAMDERSNGNNAAGEIVLTVPARGLTKLSFEIMLATAGDHVVSVPGAGDVALAQDASNAWRLESSKQVLASAAS